MKSGLLKKLERFYRNLIGRRTLLFMLAFGLIGTALLALTYARQQNETSTSDKSASVDARDIARQKTNKLIGQLAFDSQQLQQAALDLRDNPDKKASLGPKLKQLAEERKAQVLVLFRSDPKAARTLMLSKEAAASLKQNGAPAEQLTTITGQFGFKNWEDEEGVHHLDGLLTTQENKTYTIHDDRMLSTIKYGSTVRVVGYVIDDQLLVAGRTGEETPSSLAYIAGSDATTVQASDPVTVVSTTTTTTKTTGPILDAVMFANFSGGSTAAVNVERLKTIYSGTPGKDLVSYISENSYGKASLVPEYYSLGNFGSINCSDMTAQMNAMRAALAAQTTKIYDIYTFLTNCPYMGVASRAGDNPPVIYISSIDTFYAHAHELAHTMGTFLSHGGYLDCGIDVFIAPTNETFEAADCVGQEYSDRYDILGNGASAHLSPSHKLDTSWLDNTQIATSNSLGTSSYTLAPYVNSNALVALKIPRGNSGSYFTVEYRQPIGFDSDIDCAKCSPIGNATQGALVRLAGYSYWGPGGGANSNLIDTTPESVAPDGGWWPTDDGFDSTLLPGKSFTDPEYGITIKAVSKDASGLKVEVTRATVCTRAPATISTPTPTMQTAQPGEAKNYIFTVTNNDSAGCKANDYRFRPTDFPLYGGLDYTFPSNTESVKLSSSPAFWNLAPGTSRTITLTISTQPSTLAGSYGGTDFNSFSELGTIHSSTYGSVAAPIKGVRLVIPTTTDTTAPTQPTKPIVKVLGGTTAKLSWLPSSDTTRVSGYQVTLNGSNFLGTTQPSTLLTGLLPSTSYTYNVQAIDTNGNYSVAMTGSFTTPAISDTTAPTPVGDVESFASDSSIKLSWGASYDAGGIEYYTYMNGYCGPTAFGTQATANCTLPNMYYRPPNSIRIYGYDGNGNTASYYDSEVSDLRTTPPGVAQAPSKPKGLYVASHTYNTGNVIKWQASTDDQSVSGYNVYRGAARIAFTTTPSYNDVAAKSGTVYRVQAVDNQGAVSQFSEALSSTGGTAPGQTDTQPPTAAISSHTNGAKVSGTITLTTVATDNIAVDKVRYILDGKYIGEVSDAPYSLTIDTKNYSEGRHEIVAMATDKNSAALCCRHNAGSSGVTVLNFANTVSDVDAPSTPTNVVVSTASANQINISWDTSTDSIGVVSYSVLRNGVSIGSVIGSSYTDLSVMPNMSYAYQVIARDIAGNASAPSTSRSVTTATTPDTTPPSSPANLTATTVSPSQIYLVWAASTDNIGVTSYDVYRGGVKIASSSTTSFGDTGLSASTAYSYYVVARDGASNSSASSNVATATTQAPPTTPIIASIQGQIKDTSGVPLQGATVTITFNGSTRSYATNSSGYYTITGVPPGTYDRVKYAKKGYSTVSLTLIVPTNLTLTQNAILTKSGKR